jgi:hypothetical protein
MQNRNRVDDLFGPDFLDREVVPRMVATTRNARESAEMKLDNALAYLEARGSQTRVNAPLVCCLGPDEAWHTLILYTYEYSELCYAICGEYIHHDPAGEAALVNREKDIARTLHRMDQIKVHYDIELWQDPMMFPYGAKAIPSGFRRKMYRPLWGIGDD